MFSSAGLENVLARSNSPLALSVVSLTEPGDVKTTFERITAFDDLNFGFNHNQTWAAMPAALRGILDPASVATSFTKAPPRVQKCITALCKLGQENPLETRRFSDFPSAGLKSVQSIDWDPEVAVRVKGACWYVTDERARIPLLQPRKASLDAQRLSIYLTLGSQAYCKGDWSAAVVELIDLSGDDKIVEARFIDKSTLPTVSERDVREFVETFVQAKKLADKERAVRPRKTSTVPMGELLGIS